MQDYANWQELFESHTQECESLWKDTHKLRVSSWTPSFYLLNNPTPSISSTDKITAYINACFGGGGGSSKWSMLRCRKTKLYLNPMWPLFATNIAQYGKKSHHWASCHINYTNGPIIHEKWFFFLVISKCCLCCVLKKTAKCGKKDICSV